MHVDFRSTPSWPPLPLVLTMELGNTEAANPWASWWQLGVCMCL